MAKSAQEKALTSALVAVARSMGADEELVGRIRDAVNPSKKNDEIWLDTNQVMERLGLCQKKVLSLADELGVVRHSARLLRFPLSRVRAWERRSTYTPSPSEQ